jgi:hypothetical protein
VKEREKLSGEALSPGFRSWFAGILQKVSRLSRLRAAVNAIEANDYKIELPLEMALAKGPIESPPVMGSRKAKVKYPKGKRQ